MWNGTGECFARGSGQLTTSHKLQIEACWRKREGDCVVIR